MSAWDDSPAVGGSAWDDGAGKSNGTNWSSDARNARVNDAFAAAGDNHSHDGAFGGGDAGAGAGGDGCRNCGQDGHYARDCPEPRKFSGGCFNCGEQGHNKAECPNPTVERAFTGTCRLCEQEGHRAADCPTKPAEFCRGCGSDEHKAAECTVNRRIDRSKVDTMSKEEAFAAIKLAVEDHDMADVKKAIDSYIKADETVTYLDMERMFRKADIGVYCIGQEIEVAQTLTLVNLQGKAGCKYTAAFFFSPKPMRKFHVDGWPSTPEENLERLADAGVAMENFVPLCRNCNELGHMSKACPSDKIEVDRVQVICGNCNEVGHRLRDCPAERVQRGRKEMDCRRCGELGHAAKDCPNNEGGEGGGGPRACHNCGSEDHMSRECDQPRKMICRNCNEEGHASKECDKPKNPANVTCRNCDTVGHFSKECPKPRDWSKVTCDACGEVGHGRNFKGCKSYGSGSGAGTGDNTGTFDPPMDAAGTSGTGNEGAWAGDNTASAGGW